MSLSICIGGATGWTGSALINGVRAAADLGVNLVAVTLLHRKGYLRQRLDASGWQSESPVDWPVSEFLEEMPQRAAVTIEGRDGGC